MLLGIEGGDEQNNVASSSPSLTKRQQLTRTLTLPSRHALPTLPFELIEEILSRLPVKLLLQLRCACKSWNSLISNTKFQKKHLSLSTIHNLHCVTYSYFVVFPIQQSGQCVSGKINWLASKDNKKTQCFILSLQLGKESFQEVLLPNYGEVDACNLQLSVLRDSLIMFSGDDVWVMKEYGNKESWTKLFTISYMKAFIKAIHIFENAQVLLRSTDNWKDNYIFYSCKNRTSKLVTFEDIPQVCVESLISPCS